MQNKPSLPVKYVAYGLASSYSTHIEINQELVNYPPLHDFILEHERKHSLGFDVHHDWGDGINLLIRPLLFLTMIRFIVDNPSTWVDFLPFYRKNKQWIYDPNLIVLYGITLCCIAVIVYLFL